MTDAIVRVKNDIEVIESELLKVKDAHSFLEEKLQQAKDFLSTLDVKDIIDAIDDISPGLANAIEVGESIVTIVEEVIEVVQKL